MCTFNTEDTYILSIKGNIKHEDSCKPHKTNLVVFISKIICLK